MQVIGALRGLIMLNILTPADYGKVEERADYQERHYKRMAWNNPLQKVRYSLEELWLNLKHGNIGNIMKAISNRLGKTLSNATRNNNVG